MKKILFLFMALGLVYGSQAQLGGLIGGAVKKSVEKKISQTVEDKADEMLGNKKSSNDKSPKESTEQTAETTADEGHMPTPEEVMAMVPVLPSFQNLSDYACEQNRANPRTLKLLANPTTTFMTKMTLALASGYVTMMGAGQTGSVYAFDGQLLTDLGISEEEFNAMSEEEQQKLAQQYATELQERYIRTAEKLAADEGYTKLQQQYTDIDKEIESLFTKADETTGELWKTKYGTSDSPSEADMCSYFKDAVPVLYKAVNEAMNIRKTRQLPIAKQMDEYVQKMAQRYPKEVFAGFYNQGGLCATAYVNDAARLTFISDPR